LKRIQVPVSPVLEMTEVCDRTLRAKGPALLFETRPVSTSRCSATCSAPRARGLGMGAESVSELREIGKLLAFLKEPSRRRA
jgi:4-hydroxy-3-polyprenylbenzoate decarboxylase